MHLLWCGKMMAGTALRTPPRRTQESLPPMPNQHTYTSIEERFWSKVDKTDGCWLWIAGKTDKGYAHFNAPPYQTGHLWLWVQTYGEVPAGFELDHLCRVRHCVNPAHLEPVTHRENLLRSSSRHLIAHRTDTCFRGHSLLDARMNHRGNRQCRTCVDEYHKALPRVSFKGMRRCICGHAAGSHQNARQLCRAKCDCERYATLPEVS